MLSDLNLLTMKPCIYAANVSEDDLANEVSPCSKCGLILKRWALRDQTI